LVWRSGFRSCVLSFLLLVFIHEGYAFTTRAATQYGAFRLAPASRGR
jgi:hypothetical protein